LKGPFADEAHMSATKAKYATRVAEAG